jgi:nucleotide-binding universal stress UspA family protein
LIKERYSLQCRASDKLLLNKAFYSIVLTYRRILVPYDDSEYSKRALDYAVSIARAFNAQLHLLNVVEELDVTPRMERQYVISPKTGERETFQQYLKELYQNMKNSAKEMLEAQTKQIDMEGAQTKTNVVLGHTASKIVEYIRQEEIDLVVMGTMGHKGISKFAGLGSVARKVSEDAPCPVILLH